MQIQYASLAHDGNIKVSGNCVHAGTTQLLHCIKLTNLLYNKYLNILSACVKKHILERLSVQYVISRMQHYVHIIITLTSLWHLTLTEPVAAIKGRHATSLPWSHNILYLWTFGKHTHNLTLFYVVVCTTV